MPNGCQSMTENLNLQDWSIDEQNCWHLVLTRLNEGGGKQAMVQDVLMLLQTLLDFEAVGLRLQEGEDYPYDQSLGFPHKFIRLENSLCTRDSEGNIQRDPEGNPCLECMCGNVICGRTDSRLPFFTEWGTFWTNSTSELLANTTEADRQSRTRNRCNGEGYETVALIPLRNGRHCFGLLQFNDHRKNQLTSSRLLMLENVGRGLEIAFSRLEAEAELKQTIQEKDVLLREVHHRVKNNLQIVLSLLQLQTQHSPTPAAKQPIQLAQSRIHAIALVHQMIYDSPDLAKVNMNDYLCALTEQLISLSSVNKTQLRCQVGADSLLLAPDTIIPLGLIVSELLLNAVRHAFPANHRDGEIRLEAHRNEEGQLHIRLSDNGVGLQATENTPTGIGLELARDLAVHQLHGHLRVESPAQGSGTTANLSFSLPTESAAEPGRPFEFENP